MGEQEEQEEQEEEEQEEEQEEEEEDVEEEEEEKEEEEVEEKLEEEEEANPIPKRRKSAEAQAAAVSKVEAIVSGMIERKAETVAAIHKDQGAPPHLAYLDEALADLERLDARAAAIGVEQQLVAVAGQVLKVGTVWMPYFRGRVCVLIKTTLGLRNDDEVAHYLEHGANVKISGNTVFYSITYSRMCLKYPALLWSGVCYATVAFNAVALEQNADFKNLMEDLATEVTAARQRAARTMTTRSACGAPPNAKRRVKVRQGRR